MLLAKLLKRSSEPADSSEMSASESSRKATFSEYRVGEGAMAINGSSDCEQVLTTGERRMANTAAEEGTNGDTGTEGI